MTREELDLLRERYRQIKLLYCGSLEGWNRKDILSFKLSSESINAKLPLAVGAEEGIFWAAYLSRSEVSWNANHPVILAADVKKRSEHCHMDEPIFLFEDNLPK